MTNAILETTVCEAELLTVRTQESEGAEALIASQCKARRPNARVEFVRKVDGGSKGYVFEVLLTWKGAENGVKGTM